MSEGAGEKKFKLCFAAIFSGIIYALIFPKFNLSFLVFLWPLPLFEAIACVKTKKQAFFQGFLAGIAAFLLILYWIPVTIQAGGGGIFIAALGWAALSAYLALFFGLFAVMMHSVFKSPYPMIPVGSALAWILCEWLRATLFGGFPWCLLGYGVSDWVRFIQIAEWGGVWLIGFILMAISSCIWLAWRRRSWQWIAAAITILACTGLYGELRYRYLYARIFPGPKAAILQGNIDQYAKWDKQWTDEIIRVYSGLIKKAALSQPQLIVWPESAWPLIERENENNIQAFTLSLSPSLAHLVGVIIQEEGSRIYNSALLIKEGRVIDRYDKVHLVPFGEFVPAASFLSRWISVLTAWGDVTAGQAWNPIAMADQTRLGVTICYESIFPQISRHLQKQGADTLVNLTNDGWYLDTAAPYQHFQMNILRAVETRLPVIRAANTGISAVINPVGEPVAMTPLGRRTVLTAFIPFLH